MDNIHSRPIVRKKTICKSTPSFGFTDVNDLSKETNPSLKRLHSQERVLPGNVQKEATRRKIAKIYGSQEGLNEKHKSPKKIVAEQKALWRLKAKSEVELKKNVSERKKENLRELNEKSRLLLKQNLKKKSQRVKIVANPVTPKNQDVHFNTPNNEPQLNELVDDNHSINVQNNETEPEQIIPDSVASVPIENDEPCEEAPPTNYVIKDISSESKHKAAIVIQKHFRGFIARKNWNKQSNELVTTNIVESSPEKAEVNKEKSEIFSDLYVDYPYNIMSSVKNKLFVTTDDDKNNSLKLTVDEKILEVSPQIKMKKITTSSIFNYNTNDKSIKLLPEKSVITEISVHSGQNVKSPKTEMVKKGYNVISGLKSSLEEIQNLTSSFNFDSRLQDSDVNKQKVSISTTTNSISYTETVSSVSKDNRNNLNPPDVNLIWLRHGNKNMSPQALQNSFQDELNLLESFNDSLRQVQHIEKSLTSIRKEDLSSSEVESTMGDVKADDSTGITFLGSSDMSIVNKLYVSKAQGHGYQKIDEKKVDGNGFKSYQLRSKHYTLQKCFDENDKSVILSQKENIKHHLNDTSDGINSENDSIIENSIGSCVSSMDLSSYDQKHLFEFNDYKNGDMTNRLNKFCLCLVSQYIEDEKVRSEYLNTLLKVREKTLLDATRNELLCLEIQKKNNQSQIPLLKKKQRGLLLKLQQERNEIKHIKKFQQQQSQERKASLRRQLKHLKQMLACDEVMLNIKKRNKSSSAIMHTSMNSLNSPLKGINITLGSEKQSNNNSLTKIWEGLEKRRQDLNEQKKKMHDLLHLHFNNIFDRAEIKVIQEKLAKSSRDVNSVNIDSNASVNVPENMTINLTPLKTDKENPNQAMINKNKLNVIGNDLCKHFNGSTLNTLWEKITGQKCEKFECSKIYNMTKESLDIFFNDAKQVAINNILSTLQNNVNVESSIEDSVVEPYTQCLTSNKIESSSFINNLLKSEGRELADIISKDKIAHQEIMSKNENSFMKSNENLYSENLSNDGSEPSDTSKSTAHSLVEELSYLYPTADNFMESENENHISDTPEQNRSQFTIITQRNDSKPTDSVEKISEEVKLSKNVINSKDNLKQRDSSSSTEVMENNTNIMEYKNNENHVLQEHVSKNDVISSEAKFTQLLIMKNLKSKKTLVSDKSVNTIVVDNAIIKNDFILDTTIDLINKKVYPDDRSPSRFLENKSPVSAEYLSGSWESVSPSPDPSPRDSPTGEYSPAAAAALPLCHLSEAEELRRKQLAIELEIKALEQQQTQLPYCLVREIPDKPPPPYIPPSEETKVIVSPAKVVEPKTPPSISSLIELFCLWLWPKFSSGKTDLVTYSNYCKVHKFINNSQDYVYVFDVCFETLQWEFAQISNDTKEVLPWEYKKETANNNKCKNKDEMCVKVQNKVKNFIGIDTVPIRENLIISWTQKRQDFVNNLLIKELYKEETDWLNIEPFEIDVKNNLVTSILDTLMVEACNELKLILC